MTEVSRQKSHLRFFALLGLFAAEYVCLSLIPHQWFTINVYKGAPIVFGFALVFLGRFQLRALIEVPPRFNKTWAVIHAVALLLLLVLQTGLARLFDYGRGSFPPYLGWLWLGLIATVISSLLLAFVPLRQLSVTARALGSAWIYAAICSVFVLLLRTFLARSWDDPSFRLGWLLQEASFHQVAALLTWFHAAPVADPATHVLGTRRFVVQIASSCSGIEGLALISALILVWLYVERRTLQIQRVLLLVPVALGLMWVLNLLRLVVLIEIGTAGHPDVAINGFHSQAGWIFFNIVSFGFLLTVQSVPWFRKSHGPALPAQAAESELRSDKPVRNSVAIYLAPFLAITAATLLSKAVTGTFEWSYPLRLLAALFVLWLYREEYRKINWRFGWLGPVTGLGIAALWIALHYALEPHSRTPFGNALIAAPTLQRVAWIVLRGLAAVITVPIAEELAFRGYLARRFINANFEAVPYSRLTAISIVGSALIFGILHGKMWLAGTLSGVAFALVAKKRGNFGESVAAHAFANLAIAVVVVFRGDYTLWS